MFIEECSKTINDKLRAVKKKEKIAIWGAGENTVRLFQYTDILNYNISHIIDKDRKLCGNSFFGLKVTEPEMVPWNAVDVVVISVFQGQDEIKKELVEKYCFKGVVLFVFDRIQVPFYRLVSQRSIVLEESLASTFKKNSIYKNIHEGERAFILCTGPSIAEMELTKLRDERTIATSGFYLHKDCRIISPDYYCMPKFEDFYGDMAVQLLKEIQQSMQGAKFFFNIHEENLINKIGAFEKECVNYVTYSRISNYENTDIDLTGNIMGPQSVAILALEIALYMGFQTIYLLGTEHDSLRTNRYTHFYDYNSSIASKANSEEDSQGNLHSTFGKELKSICELWKQYEIIREIAERKGVKIYNATRGGQLDLFERVDYDDLF